MTSIRFGEVVAAQITEFEAQCDQLHRSPPLGALVRVAVRPDLTIIGLVAEVATGGFEPGLRPVPRGRDGFEDDAIFRAHPDLVQLLATRVRCLVVGFFQGDQISRHLPPYPPPIHYSVATCPPSEVTAFTERFDYFTTVLTARDLPFEEIIAAHIRLTADSRDPAALDAEPPYGYTVRAGRALAQLLRGDHQRLSATLQRIRRRQTDADILGTMHTPGALAPHPGP